MLDLHVLSGIYFAWSTCVGTELDSKHQISKDPLFFEQINPSCRKMLMFFEEIICSNRMHLVRRACINDEFEDLMNSISELLSPEDITQITDKKLPVKKREK